MLLHEVVVAVLHQGVVAAAAAGQVLTLKHRQQLRAVKAAPRCSCNAIVWEPSLVLLLAVLPQQILTKMKPHLGVHLVAMITLLAMRRVFRRRRPEVNIKVQRV
jgi:hypothetical protein